MANIDSVFPIKANELPSMSSPTRFIVGREDGRYGSMPYGSLPGIDEAVEAAEAAAAEAAALATPYASRAAAEAATIPAFVTRIAYRQGARVLVFSRPPAPVTYPALVTVGGEQWVPADVSTPQHWGVEGVIGAAAATETTRFQAFVNYLSTVSSIGGGGAVVPAGIYNLNTITVPAAVDLVGEGAWCTLLRFADPAQPGLVFSGQFSGISRFSTIYATTPVSGGDAIQVHASHFKASDFIIRNSWRGVVFRHATDLVVSCKMRSFDILAYESAGIFCERTGDIFISQFILQAGSASRGALGGIRLVNRNEAFIASDGDILNGQYSLTMDAASYTLGNRPAYNKFLNVYFDSAANPTSISKCVETDFVSCWFSGGRSGGGNAGVSVSSCDSVRFANCNFFNCGSHGCTVQSTAVDTTFVNCKFESNSVTTGAGVAHGLVINNASRIKVIGCTAKNGLFTGQQAYGISVQSGSSKFVIRDCDLEGNATGGLLDGTADGTAKTISGNNGYVTQTTGVATVSSGNTTVVVSHGLSKTPRPQDILLSYTSAKSGSTDLYVTTITSTQFTINVGTAPSSNVSVAWQSRIAGA